MKRTRTPNAPVALSVLLAMGLLLLMTSGPAVAQVRQEQATLTVVVGNVEVLTGGATAWRRATIGMRLAQGDEVRAATNSEAEMAMTDGSVMKVTAETRLQVRQLDADPTTRVRNSFFHLVAGRIRAVVAQVAVTLVQARQGGFVISTPTAVAAVRGSDGVVGFNPATRVMTIMSFRGVWATMEVATQRFVFAAQGQMTRAVPGSPPTTPVPVPANVQAAVLRNAPIRTPAPAAPPVITPVAAGTVAASATAVPGAPAAVPPPPPPPVFADFQAVIPPPPPPAAPAPPANQATVISAAIAAAIPLAAPPPPPAEAAAIQNAMTAAPAATAPPPPVQLQAAMTQVVVPPTIVVPPPAALAPAVIALPPPPAPPPVAPITTFVVIPQPLQAPVLQEASPSSP